MTASNLGMVFGPTLMRPERESVASIVDIKYQNIIIEMMISEREKVNVCVWYVGEGEGEGRYGSEKIHVHEVIIHE